MRNGADRLPRAGWRGKLRARSFFVSYLLVALPILLITNLLFYLLFVPVYQREVEQMNTDTVKGVQLTFDRYVRQPLEQIYLDLVVREGEASVLYPLGNPIYDDMWKLYQAHQYMKKLADGTGGLLNDLGVYYYAGGFINTSDGFLQASDTRNLLYPAWAGLLDFQSESQWRFYIEEKEYMIGAPTVSRVVYWMRNFPMGSDAARRKMTIVYTLSEPYLRQLLTQQIGFDTYEITLYTARGEVVFSTQESPLPAETLALSDTGEAVRAFQHGQQMLTLLRAPQGDLFFAFSLPRAHYFHSTDQIKLQIAVLASVALFLALVMSRMVSRYMFTPLQVIMRTAENVLQTLGNEADSADQGYTSIHTALELLTGKVQTLNHTLEAHDPELRTNFYRDLLFSQSMDGGAMEKRMAMLGIPPVDNCRVIMLELTGVVKDISFTELFKLAMIEYMRAHDEPGLSTFAMLHEEDSVIAVAAYTDEARVESLLQAVLTQLRAEEMQGTNAILLSVGGRQDDLLGVRFSLGQARAALRYGFLFPGRLLRYEEFALWESSEATLPCAQGARLFALITELSQTQVEEYLRELRGQVYAEPFSWAYLRYALLDILTSCMEVARGRGIFVDTLQEKSIFLRYEQARTYDAYESLLRDMLEDLLARIQLRRSNASYDLIGQVQAYIQSHLREELSLRAVSERFHVSYSHMSKTFKLISGMNFTEYVLQCRLEESLRLLLETELSIEEIAERIAIHNAGYYIRTFKAKYGMTPKQYRLTHARA